MLVSLSVRNFRSFRDEATLDLRAPRGVGVGAQPWDGNIQAVTGVYGANASGKTTLFEAISTMADQVRGSYRRSAVSGEPFAFDTSSAGAPTEFSAMFVAGDGQCYAYGFSVLDGAVIEEWAQRYVTTRPTLLFERHGDVWKYGTALKGPNRAVEQTTQPSSLYLSAAAAAGHIGLAPVYQWFGEQLRTYPARRYESLLGHVVTTLASDMGRCDRLVTMLSGADLGLVGIETKKHRLSDVEKTQLRQLLSENPAGPIPDEVYVAFGIHHADGRDFPLPLDQESDGTLAMLCHAFVIDEALRTGATVVFDEIDSSLHPLLVRELVRTFQDQQANPSQAQMIFTTHDVSLMEDGYGNGAQLGRDEIWFATKDQKGRSTLVALAEFKPRTRENLARRYLSGRFGGIPDQVALAPA
ncbi:MAG: AAA family ATPase [Micrococcales bacterium]|nr:AAA family ATPase [Micrococcales bacterium]